MYGSKGMAGRNAGVPIGYARWGKVMVVSSEIPFALTGRKFSGKNPGNTGRAKETT